jgi:hypothetical protein
MRKPLPPPVIIDNWPHPPIILESVRPKPKRICGVFVIMNFHRLPKRSSRKVAAKNRGTKVEGYALFPNVGFMLRVEMKNASTEA